MLCEVPKSPGSGVQQHSRDSPCSALVPCHAQSSLTGSGGISWAAVSMRNWLSSQTTVRLSPPACSQSVRVTLTQELRPGSRSLLPQPCSAASTGTPIPAPGCPPHTPTRNTSILQRYFRDAGRGISSDLLNASQICESISDVRQTQAHGGASLLSLLQKRKFHCFAHRRWH